MHVIILKSLSIFSMMPLSPSLFSISLFHSLSFIICYGVVIKDGLKGFQKLPLPKVTGPESLAFDCHGRGPYASVSDGRILKWRGAHRGWIEFAVTSPTWNRKSCDGSTDPSKEQKCGRPLALKFDPRTCNLYIGDGYYGLLMVGPSGGIAKQLTISAGDGVPFKFLNALDVETQTGVVYFSDSSTVYQRREWPMILEKGDKTGRLLKYDPTTKKVQILLQGLAFPNGVALSKENLFLLLAESIPKKIHRFWLKDPKANTSEIFVQLERAPDNIKRNEHGHFWVGLNSGRTMMNSSLENEAQIPPQEKEKVDPVGVQLDELGNLLEVLDGRGGEELDSVSEVLQHDGILWFGSVLKPYIGVLRK